MPWELDSGLLDNWVGDWLNILHLDILDGNGEGFELEAKGFGCRLHLSLFDVLSVSLLVGNEVGGRGKVSGDAGPSTAGGILERRGDGSELDRRDVLGGLGRRPLLDDVGLVRRLEDHCGEGWIGLSRWEGRSGWVGWGFEEGDMDGSYIPILASQAADMRARLWTYIICVPAYGPTHPQSHTALHTFRTHHPL